MCSSAPVFFSYLDLTFDILDGCSRLCSTVYTSTFSSIVPTFTSISPTWKWMLMFTFKYFEFLKKKKSVTNSHPLQQEEEGNDEGDEDDAGMVGDGVEEELPLLPHELHQVVQQHACFNLLLLCSRFSHVFVFQLLLYFCQLYEVYLWLASQFISKTAIELLFKAG